MMDAATPTRRPLGLNKPRSVTTETGPRRIDSRQLLGTGVELIIRHKGGDYRLRHTSNGKLILTK